MGMTLYTRRGCGLCEEAEELLAGVPDLAVMDVDSSSDLVAAYGLRVPVLVRRDEVILEGRFTEDAVAAALGHEA